MSRGGYLDDLAALENTLPSTVCIRLDDDILFRSHDDQGDASVLTCLVGRVLDHVAQLASPTGERVGIARRILLVELRVVDPFTEFISSWRLKSDSPEHLGKQEVRDGAGVPVAHELSSAALYEVARACGCVFHEHGSYLEGAAFLAIVVNEIGRHHAAE